MSQIQQDAFVADFDARGREADVAAARADLTRVARERDDARARVRIGGTAKREAKREASEGSRTRCD